jgi:hypothetical protein
VHRSLCANQGRGCLTGRPVGQYWFVAHRRYEPTIPQARRVHRMLDFSLSRDRRCREHGLWLRRHVWRVLSRTVGAQGMFILGICCWRHVRDRRGFDIQLLALAAGAARCAALGGILDGQAKEALCRLTRHSTRTSRMRRPLSRPGRRLADLVSRHERRRRARLLAIDSAWACN